MIQRKLLVRISVILGESDFVLGQGDLERVAHALPQKYKGERVSSRGTINKAKQLGLKRAKRTNQCEVDPDAQRWLTRRLQRVMASDAALDAVMGRVLDEATQGTRYTTTGDETLPGQPVRLLDSGRGHDLSAYATLGAFLAQPYSDDLQPFMLNDKWNGGTIEGYARDQYCDVLHETLEAIIVQATDHAPPRVRECLNDLIDVGGLLWLMAEVQSDVADADSSGSWDDTIARMLPQSFRDTLLRLRPTARKHLLGAEQARATALKRMPQAKAAIRARVGRDWLQENALAAVVRYAYDKPGLSLVSLLAEDSDFITFETNAQRCMIIRNVKKWLRKAGDANAFDSVLAQLFFALEDRRLSKGDGYDIRIASKDTVKASDACDWPFVLAHAIARKPPPSYRILVGCGTLEYTVAGLKVRKGVVYPLNAVQARQAMHDGLFGPQPLEVPTYIDMQELLPGWPAPDRL